MVEQLYHGTSNTHVGSILTNGLLARGGRKSNWEAEYQAQSHQEFVYLTASRFNAQFYALRAACANSSPEGLVVKVDFTALKKTKCYPDENYVINKPVNTLIDRATMLQGQEKIKENKSHWQECLDQRGILCYYKRIKSESFIDIEVIPNESNPFKFLMGDSLREFDNRFSIIIRAASYFKMPATFYSDRIDEYEINKTPDGYWCYVPTHGTVEFKFEADQNPMKE